MKSEVVGWDYYPTDIRSRKKKAVLDYSPINELRGKAWFPSFLWRKPALASLALSGNAHNKIEKRGFRLLLFDSLFVRASARLRKKRPRFSGVKVGYFWFIWLYYYVFFRSIYLIEVKIKN